MIFTNLMALSMGASMVNAHMIMSSPTPFGKATLNNSPLAADGSDFPCKLREGVFEAPTAETILGIGESHPLTFVGSATHGGGSCQISLTTDLEPTKSSKWKVIKSFEGGCPANVDGNLSGGPDVENPTTFNFSIPDGVAPGKYVLAWTWFNRIGNREMYMNCAPITVSGGSSKRSPQELEKRAADFPDMFVANVNGCMTKESIDIRFPQPGSYVEYMGNPSNLAPEGSEACTGTPTFGGSGSSNSGSSSSGPDAGSGNSGADAGSPSSTTDAGAPTVPPVSPPSPPTAEPEPAPTTTDAPAPAPTNSSGSTAGALTGSCSSEGQWNCIGGSAFQRCASGAWSAVQQMSTGTQCNAGLNAELVVSASKKARYVSSMRFRKRSIHGALHGSRFA